MLNLKRFVGTTAPFSIVCPPGGKKPPTRHDWTCIPLYSDKNYDVFLILGEDESFRDDVLQWAKYALHLPWYESVNYGKLHKFFDSKNYELIRKNEPGKANLSFFIEPHGVHDSMLYFEDVIGGSIGRTLKRGKMPNLKVYDRRTYFGIVRHVEFLNSTL